MSQKRLMIIGASWEQEDLLRAAKALGCYVIATDSSPNAPFLFLADECHTIEARNIDAHFRLAYEKKIDGVTADQCDYSHYTASLIAERLGLSSSGLCAVQNATNKKNMRDACKLASIHQPKFYSCKYYEEAISAATELGYPVMVKPLDNRGNFGASMVEESSQLKDAFYDAISHAHSRECLVEKFIHGTMYTVDGFIFSNGIHQSLGIAEKALLDGRKRVANKILYRSNHSAELADQLRKNHESVVQALGLKLGCTHGEYIVNQEGEIYLVECANRGGGVYTSSRILPAISGYNISEMLVRLALGEHVLPQFNKYQENAVILHFFQLEPGQIEAFENIDIIRSMPGILAFRLALEIGDTVHPIVDDAGRHGFVIATASTADEAQVVAHTAMKKLVVKYGVASHVN
jgi:biotin carboxylase